MKMKISTKPISSPGRAEKYYPPPLMRFLRSNVGSRSRGRSRSSPLFILRRRNTAVETQEPSSPKVTCMGQVRVRRTKQPGKKRNGAQKKRRCRWIRNALFCHQCCDARKLKPTSFSPSWPKCLPFFRVSFRSKSKIREDSSRMGSRITEKTEDSVQKYQDEDDEDEQEEAKVFASSSSIPPRNALLLTRCRSAPYRSSSLAVRFWGSPVKSEETEQEDVKTEQENREKEERPTSERESVCSDSDLDSTTDPESDEKPGLIKELESSIEVREKFVKPENTENSQTEELDTVRPLVLTRCKSEPARTGEKLDPELSFWKKRRLGFT